MLRLVLCSLFLVSVVTALKIHEDKEKRHHHGFHQLSKIAGFYPNSGTVCHPKGHHHVHTFHHRTPKGQFVKLSYNVSFRKELNFARIEGNIAHMACGNNNTLVMLRYHNNADAELFLQELEISHVVASFPPFLCKDSNSVNLFVHEYGIMEDNVTIFIGGVHVGPLDAFSHAEVDFTSNMLDGNSMYFDPKDNNPRYRAERVKKEPAAKETPTSEKESSSATSRKVLQVSTDPTFDSDMFAFLTRAQTKSRNDRFQEISADQAKRNRESRAGALGNLDKLQVPSRTPGPLKIVDPYPPGYQVMPPDSWRHRRHMRKEGFFGWLFTGGDLDMVFKYRPQTPKKFQETLAQLEGDILDKKQVDAEAIRGMQETTDIWEWRVNILGEDENDPKFLELPAREGVNEGLKDFFSKFVKLFVPENGVIDPELSLNMYFQIRMNPFLLFKMKYDSSLPEKQRLKELELSLSFYYQKKFNIDFTLTATNKQEFEVPIFSLAPICIPIPISVVSIMLCPTTSIKMQASYKIEATITKQYQWGTYGFKKYKLLGGGDGTAKAMAANNNVDSFQTSLPNGFDAYIGKSCNLDTAFLLPVTAPLTNPVTTTLDLCALRCAKNKDCQAIAYDKTKTNGKTGAEQKGEFVDSRKREVSQCYLFSKNSRYCEKSDGSAMGAQLFPWITTNIKDLTYAVAGGDNTLRIVRPLRDIPTAMIIQETKMVNAVAIGMDTAKALWIATGGEAGIRIYNVAALNLDTNMKDLKVSSGTVYTMPTDVTKIYKVLVTTTETPAMTVVNSVAITPDCSYIISGSQDGSVRVWSFGKDTAGVITGALVTTMTHTDGTPTPIYSVHSFINPPRGNGLWVVSGGSDATVRLWTPFSTYTATTKTVAAASAQNVDNFAGLWKHSGPIRSVAFSNNGKYVVSGSDDKSIRVWELKYTFYAHLDTYNYHTGGVNSVTFSPDDAFLLSGSVDTSMLLWTWGEKSNPKQIYDEHSGLVTQVSWLQDRSKTTPALANGAYLLSASADGRTILWDYTVLGPNNVYDTGTTMGIDAWFIASNKVVTTSGNTIAILSNIGGTGAQTSVALTTKAATTNIARCVSVSLDYKYGVSGGSDGFVRMWDLSSGTAVAEAFTAVNHGEPVNGVCVTHVRKRIVSVSATKIKYWEYNTDIKEIPFSSTETTKPYFTNPHVGEIKSVDFSFDGKFMVTGGNDRIVRLWDVDSRTFVAFEGHEQSVTYVAFTGLPAGDFMASGGLDKKVILYNVVQRSIAYILEGHTAAITSISFSLDGVFVISGDANGVAILWDAVAGRRVRTFPRPADFSKGISAVDFSPDSSMILTTYPEQGKTLVWKTFALRSYTIEVPTPKVVTIGDTNNGVPNTFIFFDKKGSKYPDDFERATPWTTNIAVKASIALVFEQALIIGVGDPTGNIIGATFGGPFMSITFALTFEGSLNGKTFTPKSGTTARPTVANWQQLDIVVYPTISFDVGLAIKIGLVILGKQITIFELSFTFATLFSHGGKDKPFFRMGITVERVKSGTAYQKSKKNIIVCPVNMAYRVNPFSSQLTQYENTEDTTSKFYWPTTACTATQSWAANQCAMEDCPPKITDAAGHHAQQLQIAGTTIIEPGSADVLQGICDGEAFTYQTTVTFIESYELRLNMYIGQGAVGTAQWKNSACRIRGFYRIRGNWSNQAVELIHVPDPVYDIKECWMQSIPRNFRAYITPAGDKYGLWIYHEGMFCADQHLRFGSTETTLNDGEILANEMTMQSNPPYSQLMLHKDGNLVLYSYLSDLVLWESGTGVSGTKPVTSSLRLQDGIVRLDNTVDGVTKSTVLNPNSPATGRFLRVVGCDIHLYPDSRLLPFTSVFNFTNKECISLPAVTTSAPKWHTGGSYLYRGESLVENAGLANKNGFFEHERGRVHFTPATSLTPMWSLTDESLRTVRTKALTLQWDGNLVLTDYEGKIVWSSDTAGKGATVLRLEKCGIALYKTYPNVDRVWSKGLDVTCPEVPDGDPMPRPPPRTAYPTPLNRLEPGQSILPGQSLLSNFGQLYHQLDGNVVIISRDNRTVPTPLWSTNTAGKCTTALMLQYDGQLRLFGCDGKAVWNAETGPNVKLIELRDDCTLHAYDMPLHTAVSLPQTVSKSINTQQCGVNVPVTPLSDYTDIPWLDTKYPFARGQTIMTGEAALTLQPNGDLVFYALNPVRIMWRSNTQDQCFGYATVTAGNLLMYSCNSEAVGYRLLKDTEANAEGDYLAIKGYELSMQNKYSEELWNSRPIQTLTIAAVKTGSSSATTTESTSSVIQESVIISVIVTFVVTSIIWGIVTCCVYTMMKKKTTDQGIKSGSLSEVTGLKPWDGQAMSPTSFQQTNPVVEMRDLNHQTTF